MAASSESPDAGLSTTRCSRTHARMAGPADRDVASCGGTTSFWLLWELHCLWEARHGGRVHLGRAPQGLSSGRDYGLGGSDSKGDLPQVSPDLREELPSGGRAESKAPRGTSLKTRLHRLLLKWGRQVWKGRVVSLQLWDHPVLTLADGAQRRWRAQSLAAGSTHPNATGSRKV